MSGPPSTTFSQLTRQTSRSSNTANKTRHHHHHHHHPHLHRHHNKRELEQNESTLVSASSTGVNDILHHSAWGSGSKEYVAGGSGEEGKYEKERHGSLKTGDRAKVEKKEVTWEQVRRAREKRKECEETLHSNLITLSALAHTTTRRLDYTYYNLLSSIPLIRQTISSLSSLSELTTSLHTNFTSSSIPSFVTSTNEQISTLSSSFEDDAAGKIKRLEERMKEARERVEKLGGRVEGVRGRVEGWEKRSKIRGGRGRWGWGCLVLLIVVLLVAVLGRHGDEVERDERRIGVEKPERVDELTMKKQTGNQTGEWARLEDKLDAGLFEGEANCTAEGRRSEAIKEEMNTLSHFQKGDDQDQDQDERLRLFDEL